MEHRWIENGLAILGGVIAASYVLGVEVIPHVCYSLGKCIHAPVPSNGIPWGVVILVGACVLPKTVGRATAGRVWDVVAGRIGRRSGTTPKPPEDSDVTAG